MSDQSVLVVHISRSPPSFVQKDIDIIGSEFPVRTFHYSGRSDVPLLAAQVLKSSLTFSWFAWDQASWAVRFSRLTRKPSVVVVGGFDVVNMPEISYGNLLNKRSARRTRYAISRATKTIAVSRSIKEGAFSLSGRSDIDVVYHGFDSERFRLEGEKEDLVLTVGEVNESNMQRKGILTFLKAAELLPDVRFAAVGRVRELPPEHRRLLSLPNVEVPGFVSDEDLLDYMQAAKVYVQVSAHEGFGCSLAEAMLCECIPIVTSRGALPEVVGESGFYAQYGDVAATAETIVNSMDCPDKGREARLRVIREFPLARRKKKLLEMVRSLLD